MSAALLLAAAASAQPVASVGGVRVTEPDAPATALMTFTVSLSSPSPETVAVGYRFGGAPFASASWGSDFVAEAAEGILTFEPGQTTKTIPVTVMGDSLQEGEEVLTLSIWDEGGVDADDRDAVGVIVDDEPPALGVGPGVVRVRFPILQVRDPASGTWQPGAGSVRVTAFYGYPDEWGYESDWRPDLRWQWEKIRWYDNFMITSSGRIGNAESCEFDPDDGDCGGFAFWDCEEWYSTTPDDDRLRLTAVYLNRNFDLYMDCTPAGSCWFSGSAGESLGKAQRPYGCWDDYDHMAFDYARVQSHGNFIYEEDGYVLGSGTFAAEPRVSIADARSVAERGYITFTLSLDAASSGRTRVSYATQDGTAVAGLDYVPLAGTVTFEPGELKKTVKVGIVKDVIREEDETFSLVVTDAVGAGVLRGAGTGTITDDEVFTVALPATVVGCLPASVKITLPGVAPAGGVTVTLSSGNPNLVVPASLFFKAGTLSKTIKATTLAVAAREPATVTAFMPGEVATDTVTLKPMGPKSQPGLVPNPVIGGTSVAGTVTLQCPAGPGDIVVSISSSVPSVAVPVAPTVVVPAGTQTWPFGVTTFPVDRQRLPTISVTANGISKGKTLTVNP